MFFEKRISQLLENIMNGSNVTYSSRHFTINVNDNNPFMLKDCNPEDAMYFDNMIISERTVKAILWIEADPTTINKTKVVRFLSDRSSPTSTDGFPLGDGDVYTIESKKDLFNFEIIGIEAGKSHIIHVDIRLIDEYGI